MCGNVHSASNSINNQLLNIHPFIYSSPFIQDPVSLKHPEAKHSSAHQGRINVRQCAHFRHILSKFCQFLTWLLIQVGLDEAVAVNPNVDVQEVD